MVNLIPSDSYRSPEGKGHPNTALAFRKYPVYLKCLINEDDQMKVPKLVAHCSELVE